MFHVGREKRGGSQLRELLYPESFGGSDNDKLAPGFFFFFSPRIKKMAGSLSALPQTLLEKRRNNGLVNELAVYISAKPESINGLTPNDKDKPCSYAIIPILDQSRIRRILTRG